MTYILSEKINVGISLCNFGAKVRWNMRGWDRIAPLGRERYMFNWTPVCPEIMSGLGIPRASIKLTGGNGEDFWNGKARIKNRGNQDITEKIKTGNLIAFDILKNAQCEAFLFMEGSPSCGVYRTTLKNRRLGKPPGTFGALLLKEDIFLIPALDLDSPVKWWDWRRRLHAFVWLKRKEIASKKELYDIWHNFKFICQEVSVPEAGEIGRQLAHLKDLSPGFVDQWKSNVLQLLRHPSSFARIKSIMQKHFAHYNKHFTGKSEKIAMPDAIRSKHKFVNALEEMEKRAFLEGYGFTGTPVIFRD